jgi:nucleoside-diphosphate-sugar epimerase
MIEFIWEFHRANENKFRQMKKTISILGCGWLGFPLATYLQNKGLRVKGSTTSDEKLAQLSKNGIKPYLIDLSQTNELPIEFFKADYLLINVPPSKLMRRPEAYQSLIDQVSKQANLKVIFVSSTSVYKENNGIVTEESTNMLLDGENELLDIERLFQKAVSEITIIRFGGLIGGQRYPGRFFTPNRMVKGANQPVNLIHLNDCIQLIDAVLSKNSFGEVYNGVADTHPDKKTFYTKAINLNNGELPVFSEEEMFYKLVSNQKAKDRLGIEFKHADLLAMLDDDKLWNRL